MAVIAWMPRWEGARASSMDSDSLCGIMRRKYRLIIVRFRMHRALAILLALLVATRPDVVLAQTIVDVLITMKSDGTCQATGLKVPCREIGPKLRAAGIPRDAHIRFTGGTDVRYDVISATIQSVMHAGFTNTKIGFITTEPAR